MKEIVGK
jgi:hypothetical protein